jgi:ABC-type amino acid transport substrate-binding protein
MKKVFKISMYTLTLSLICIIISGCSTLLPEAPSPKKNFIIRTGVAIRPPFVFQDKNKELNGLDIALLKLLAEENNFRLEISKYPLNELMFALRRGAVDLIASGYTKDEISANFFTPCAPYMKTGQRVIVNDEIAPFITDKSQLDNDKVTVYTVVGSTSADKVKEIFTEAKTVSLKDIASCVAKVKKGKGNIFLLLARDAMPLVADKKSRLAIVLGVLSEEEIVWGIRRKEDKWRDFFNNYMTSLKREGRLKEIIEKTNATQINE